MDDSAKRKEWLKGKFAQWKERYGSASAIAQKLGLNRSAMTGWDGTVDPYNVAMMRWTQWASLDGVDVDAIKAECDSFVEGTSPKHDAPDRVPGAMDEINNAIAFAEEHVKRLRIVREYLSHCYESDPVKNSRLNSDGLLVSLNTSERRSLDDLATEHVRQLIEQVCSAQGIYQEEFLEIAQSQINARQEIAFSLRMGLPLSGDQLGAIAYGLQQLGYNYDSGELARIQNDSTNQHC